MTSTRREEFREGSRPVLESVSSRDYEIGAAKLIDPVTGAPSVGMVCTSKANGKRMALTFETEPEMLSVMQVLMQAGKEVWPRGEPSERWDATEHPRAKKATDPKALRDLPTEVTVPGGMFTQVDGDGAGWRIALVCVPSDGPPNGVVVTMDMPVPGMKPVALTFATPDGAAEFLSGFVGAVTRLWPEAMPGAPPPAPPRGGPFFRTRRRRTR